MSTLEEKRGRGFHIVSEANGHRSREAIIVAAGDLSVGTILGEITASPGEFKQIDLAETDGTEVAAAVLFDRVDATLAAVDGVGHVRDAEVFGSQLIYPTGSTPTQIATIDAQLEALGIIVRT